VDVDDVDRLVYQPAAQLPSEADTLDELPEAMSKAAYALSRHEWCRDKRDGGVPHEGLRHRTAVESDDVSPVE
jgi:hypothetical protein